MATARRNTLKFLRSTRTLKVVRPKPRIARVSAKPTTAQIVRAFIRAPGHEQILKRIPKAATVEGWDKGTQVAYFSVCGKSGSARWLDLWDADHFDLVTDMQRCLNTCRAWFSHLGYTTWGSAQTHTGRINCYFDAATAGDYSCVVQLQSDGPSAQVECLIDNFSYGNLNVVGTLVWPHFATLSAGGHSFRIRQVSGALFFLSLTIYHF